MDRSISIPDRTDGETSADDLARLREENQRLRAEILGFRGVAQLVLDEPDMKQPARSLVRMSRRFY